MKNEIMDMLKELKPEEDFEDSGAFIDEELLDSFDVITLISMIEEKYGVSVDGLDIVPENFQNIDAMIKLVEKSRKA